MKVTLVCTVPWGITLVKAFESIFGGTFEGDFMTFLRFVGTRRGRLPRGGLGRGLLLLPPAGARRGRLVVMKGGHGRMTGCHK